MWKLRDLHCCNIIGSFKNQEHYLTPVFVFRQQLFLASKTRLETLKSCVKGKLPALTRASSNEYKELQSTREALKIGKKRLNDQVVEGRDFSSFVNADG